MTSDEERETLRQTVRQLLEGASSSTGSRELMASDVGYDPSNWAELDQLGLKGIAVPEALGGGGGDYSSLAVVLEEMGRALYCGPFLSTVCMAIPAIMNAGSQADRERLIPRLLAGEEIGTLALADDPSVPTDTVARKHGERHLLRGRKVHVVDGHSATALIVQATEVDGRPDGALFLVEGDSDGLSREQVSPLDLTRRLATVTLDGVVATRLGDAGESHTTALRRTVNQTRACLAIEMIGGANRCLDMALEHAKSRFQFGRPIGSFQAVKHKCADMFIDLVLARSVAERAIMDASHPGRDGELDVTAVHAKAHCADTYVRIAEATIQIHGGIGFTWEHDAHLYLKRAKSCQYLFGSPSDHRSYLADALDL